MFNPNHQHYVEYHMRDVQHEVEQAHLANVAQTQAPMRPVVRRVMTAVGTQMVASGRGLLARVDTERPEAQDWEYIGRVLS
jgi:hypothetical protein